MARALNFSGFILAGILSLATIAGIATEAAAASALCRNLETQLASARGGNSAQARKYSAAIAAQRNEIAKARGQASAAGCRSFLFFGGGVGCGGIQSKIDRMQANLRSLQARYETAAGGHVNRGAILARIDALGCRDGNSARRLPDPIEASAKRDDGLRGRLLKDIRKKKRDESKSIRWIEDAGDNVGVDGPVVVSSTYRTLCVRTCDGYFFPMSFSTTPQYFDRDQKACESACPGTEVSLYVHRSLGEESEDMKTPTGVPYSKLPTAYAYKQEAGSRPLTCGCHAKKDFSILAGKTEEAKPAEPAAFTPAPQARPDPGLPPEAATNAAAGLTPEKAKALVGGAATAETERKVRVVGPAYLPDPSEALDLTSPGRTAVQ